MLNGDEGGRGHSLTARIPSREPGYLLTRWVIGAITISALYLGRAVFIPIALAVLLSFLLAPAVALLRRLRVPRVPAVLLAVALALGVISVTGAIIFSQASTLSDDAPAYAQRITARIENLRTLAHERLSFVMRTSERGSDNPNARRARRISYEPQRGVAEGAAVPVELRDPPPTPFQDLARMISPLVAPVETTLLVLILAVFILFQRSDLRDRLIRLFGARDLHQTSVALDDGAQRLSRYFLSQFAVNGTFGAIIWLALFLIGVPSPALWGILAGLLRFVPYIGVVIAALGPLALAAAIDPGWSTIIGVALLFAVVEPVIGYVIEPLLYGRSTGLSPVTVVVAAVFWTWIWGALGLILSMPLTLMLVALGRHVPAFAFFDILFGDRPALSASETFYQRILHGHVDDALDHAEDMLSDMPLSRYFDHVVLEGLRLAAADMDRGLIDREALRVIASATIFVANALAGHVDDAANMSSGAGLAPSPPDNECADVCVQPASCAAKVTCIAARGPLDLAVSALLCILLQRRGCEVEQIDRARWQEISLGSVSEGEGILCITGLFGPRAYRRVARMRAQLQMRSSGKRVLVAVRRASRTEPVADQAIEPEATLSSAIEALVAPAA